MRPTDQLSPASRGPERVMTSRREVHARRPRRWKRWALFGLVGALVVAVGGTAFALTHTGASDIGEIDAAINNVSAQRAEFGAVQNRLDHTLANLATYHENLVASESRIRDADMAQEMLGFTRSQILSQAGTAMLAQANQSSQGVLSLLR